MAKITTTVRIDYETYDYIKQNAINLSKFIEESIYGHIKKEGTPQDRIKQLKQEIKNLEFNISNKQTVIKQIAANQEKQHTAEDQEKIKQQRLALLAERDAKRKGRKLLG